MPASSGAGAQPRGPALAAAVAWRCPRSFLGRLLAGFALIALPLSGALLYTTWRTDELAEQSRDAVINAAQAARASRALVNQIGALERLALQLTVIPDLELKDAYERAHRRLAALSVELARLPMDDRQQAALARLLERERTLRALLAGAPAITPQAAAVREAAAALRDHAGRILAVGDGVADREIKRLSASVENAQYGLLVALLLAAALTVAVALVLARSIARPIAELDSAIRQLGSAEFDRAIGVSGPEDLRQLGERLEWLRRRLIELESQRTCFLRHLSHDLKTPLAALREGAELLHDQVAGPLAPPQQQVVAILRDNSFRLQRMIEELLDYQRALHASANLELDTVSLDALLRDSVRAHRLAARAKAQRMVLSAASLTVRADGGKLRSIVDNLVGNAVKFAPPGGVIELLAHDLGESVAIEVLDSGPGVAAEEREAIFEAFFRGGGRAQRRQEGAGLGLAIAREFAHAHGGRLEVIPEARGAHFRLTLPKQPDLEFAEAA